MNSPRRRTLRLSAEHALLLGALALLVAGSLWIARSPAAESGGETGSWLGSLPSVGLPLVRAVLQR